MNKQELFSWVEIVPETPKTLAIIESISDNKFYPVKRFNDESYDNKKL